MTIVWEHSWLRAALFKITAYRNMAITASLAGVQAPD
jgi:hypothetical protein